MTDHVETIRTALQGAMVGAWGRENALRSLEALDAENRRLRDALEKVALVYEWRGADYLTVTAREMHGIARATLGEAAA